MLERYALPPMRELWLDEETKFKKWLEVELAILKARVSIGEMSVDTFQGIEEHARVDVKKIKGLEEVYEHDMIAFIVQVQESLETAGLGQHKEKFHKGVTSYDIEDPALVLMLREATKLILDELDGLVSELKEKAEEHQWTLMIARTHGQYAEPSTFGHLLLVFWGSLFRSYWRLDELLNGELCHAKISGAVGNYGGMETSLEHYALECLGLSRAEAETQILQRDRHATLLNALAVTAGVIEQIARTFWEMMRSDVGELREPRKEDQRGSSAMAHKRNPVITERLMGLSRIVRAYALVGMENIATPEWRDISQSSAERHIFPEATGLLHYMIGKMRWLVENLEVFPKRMAENLKKTGGIWAGQRIRNALMEGEVSYEVAYLYVQRIMFKVSDKGSDLLELLRTAPLSSQDARTASGVLSKQKCDLNSLLDARSYIERGIVHMFQNV
jgi:adenylosuccinate lyase